MTDAMRPQQQCHLCRESLPGDSEEEVSRNAIEHFRLFHPDLHDTIKHLTDAYLTDQFQRLRPEDFAG